MIIHFFPCIVSCVDVDWFPEWQSLTASELPFVGISHRVEAGSWLIPTSPLKNDVHCMVRTRDLRSSYGLTHSMCQGFFFRNDPYPYPYSKTCYTTYMHYTLFPKTHGYTLVRLTTSLQVLSALRVTTPNGRVTSRKPCSDELL